jgi:RNA polymerase sigma-70 factor (ECF subfamily)
MIKAMKKQASAQSDTPDEALMLAYGQGDFSAFETLYKRHKDGVFRYLLRQGLCPSIAEELLQDIWSKVINARQSYSVSAKFCTWLYRIARNRVIDHYRANKELVQLVDEHSPVIDDSEQTDPDQQMRLIRATVTALPFPQRQALLLHYEAGLSVNEVAEVTEEHPEAVKSSIRYAIKKLSRLLRSNDE